MKYLVILSIFLTGCSTAPRIVDTVSNVRDSAARLEMKANAKQLCRSNLDAALEVYGKNREDWEALLRICGVTSFTPNAN